MASGPVSRRAGFFGTLLRRRPGKGPTGGSYAEIALPSVVRWLESRDFTLDVIVEMPDGRSMPMERIAGREAETTGAAEVARAAMAVRDARLSGLRLALSTDLRILVRGCDPVHVPMFNPAAAGLRALLAELADDAARDECVYDNLDQGWALRLDLRGAFLEVMEWDWEAPASAAPRMALRLPRDLVRTEAVRASVRFEQVHAALVAAAGEDLWSPRW